MLSSARGMEWSLVSVVLIICHAFLMIYCFLRLTAVIQGSLASLDSTIAQAIQKVIEGGVGEFEPINPVQAALAQFISTRLGDMPGQAQEVQARKPDGKF